MLNEGEHANERDFGSYPLPYSVERHRLSAKEFFFQIKGPWSSVHAGGVEKRGKGNTKEAEDS